MKKFLLLLLTLSCLFLLPLPVSAAESIVLIDSESSWQYYVVDDKGFEEMDAHWMASDYVANWDYGTAPFGDRIVNGQAATYGWVGENDGIFLRKAFKINSNTNPNGMNFYIRTFYDNTIHIYLNGTEIFSHDNGGANDWVDDYKLYKLDGIEDLLKNGKNVLAVSVHDNAGGREFDLSFFATTEELDDSTNAPSLDNPSGDLSDQPEDLPADFGNTLPFTKVTVNTAPPVVTVYLPSEAPPPAPSPSYIAPLTMMGSSFLIAIGMIVTALLISRKHQRSNGGNRQ